jgi:hypothetical protein
VDQHGWWNRVIGRLGVGVKEWLVDWSGQLLSCACEFIPYKQVWWIVEVHFILAGSVDC